MKGIAKGSIDLAARAAVLSGFVRLLEKMGDRRRNLLRVLTYHRVDHLDARPDLYPNLIGATPEEFDRQMSFLAANYRLVSMQEVLDALVRGTALPPGSVLITFDDAYRDFAEHAWPILQRYQLPVTLFVPTAFPDAPRKAFWWDRLYQAVREATECEAIDTAVGRIPLASPQQRAVGLRQLISFVKSRPHDEAQQLVDRVCADLDAPTTTNPVLGWESLRKLAADGVTLAPHTRHHPLLNRVSPEQAQREIAGSLDDLQREVGRVLPVFAYPGGAYNRQVVRRLPRTGIQLAFITWRGLNDPRTTDPLRIRRINVGRRTNLALMRTELLPWAVHLNRWAALPDGD